MLLDNQTSFPARILRVELVEGQVQAVLIVKTTFERDAPAAGDGNAAPFGGRGARWVAAAEQLPLIDDRLDTPFGVFHTDCFARKDGVDVCVLGTVRPARPSRVVDVRLDVAGHSSALTVFGDRRWVRAGTRLTSSAPLPFDEMPLAYSRAYGGVTEHDYETAVWPDNPLGRGYYLSAARAEGQPLPNVEPGGGAPQVRDWQEQPTTAGWAPYPMFWGLRANEGVVPPRNPGSGEMARLRPRLNNNAHPSMIVTELPARAEVRIRGLRGTDIMFELPAATLAAEVQVGAQRTGPLDGRVDGVFIWADAGRVTLTQRFPFAYSYRKGELRQARLVTRGS